jgi:hypothetical protein
LIDKLSMMALLRRIRSPVHDVGEGVGNGPFARTLQLFLLVASPFSFGVKGDLHEEMAAHMKGDERVPTGEICS